MVFIMQIRKYLNLSKDDKLNFVTVLALTKIFIEEYCDNGVLSVYDKLKLELESKSNLSIFEEYFLFSSDVIIDGLEPSILEDILEAKRLDIIKNYQISYSEIILLKYINNIVMYMYTNQLKRIINETNTLCQIFAEVSRNDVEVSYKTEKTRYDIEKCVLSTT